MKSKFTKTILNFLTNLNWLHLAVVVLIGVQIYTIVMVASLSLSTPGQIDELETQINRTIDSTFASDSTVVSMDVENLKTLMSTAVERSRVNVEGVNFVTIILTLLTICLTLSVVIPYIVGEAITKAKIRETAQELYMSDMMDQNGKYATSIRKLELSEAHSCRMIAYLLQKVTPENPYDAIWSAGWAAKALTRYLRNISSGDCGKRYKDYPTFINDSLKSITVAINAFNAKISERKDGPYDDSLFVCYKRTLVSIADAYFISNEHYDDVTTVQLRKEFANCALNAERMNITNIEGAVLNESKWLNEKEDGQLKTNAVNGLLLSSAAPKA